MSRYKPYPAYKDSGTEWLGEVPEGWRACKLKHLGKLKGGTGFPHHLQGNSHNEIAFYKSSDLFKSEDGINLGTTDNTVTYDQAKTIGATIFAPGTLAWGKIGAASCLNRGRVVQKICCLDNNMTGFIVDENITLVMYSFYFMSIVDFSIYAKGGVIPFFSEGEQGNLRALCPPLNEQERIVDHLDHETTIIDALIQKNTRLMELLKEKRFALITAAVTKGLDPNAKMKESGVEWIGEVPEGWEVMQIKRLARGNGTLFVGGVWLGGGYERDGEVRYITSSNVGVGNYKDNGGGYISETTFEELCCEEVLPGDVIISRLTDPIGRACIVPNIGKKIVTSVDNIILRHSLDFSSKFIVHRFSSLDYFNELNLLASGTTLQRVSREDIGSVRIAFPKIYDQEKIATYIDNKTNIIDELIEKTKLSIEKLKERRSSFITAAVTGKIDIREAALPTLSINKIDN